MKQKIELTFKGYRHCRMFEFDEKSNDFVELIERVVNNLPDIEKELIEERYMVKNADYITDRNVYEFKMTDPISAPYYDKLRTRAFEKIDMMLESNKAISYD